LREETRIRPQPQVIGNSKSNTEGFKPPATGQAMDTEERQTFLERLLIWYSPSFFPGLKPESFLAAFIALAKASAPTPKGVGFHLLSYSNSGTALAANLREETRIKRRTRKIVVIRGKELTVALS
jgi:hypothetical protein